jgi:hypothetical protein
MLRADTAFVMFLDTQGDLTLVKKLLPISTEWKALKEQGKVTTSLRSLMLTAFMTELKARLAVAMEPDSMTVLQRREWLTQEGWLYQQWDPELEKSIPDSARPPLPHEEAKTLVEELAALVAKPGVVHRFSATRPLSEDYKGPILPFQLVLGVRGSDSDRAHILLQRLANNALTRLVGMRMRSEYARRSDLANQLQTAAARLMRQRPNNPTKGRARVQAKRDQPEDDQMQT